MKNENLGRHKIYEKRKMKNENLRKHKIYENTKN